LSEKAAVTVKPRLTIIGGFLGAGKTTLLNHIIKHAKGQRFAFVVNDFGDINIDARLVVSVEGETIALTNGCICCVIREDLVREVEKLCRSEEPPTHIIIEASGVSRPVAIVESFLGPECQQMAEVQNIITLLDADQAVDGAKTYADLAFAQIAVADIVVVNKTDLVDPRQVEELRTKIEAIVPRARIFETTFGAIPVDLLFDHDASAAITPVAALAESDQSNSARHRREFAAWSYRSDDKAFSFNAMQRIVEHLPIGIFRAKGVVRLDVPSNDYGLLQVTGRRGWLKLIACDSPTEVVTEIAFIGKPGATSKEALRDHIEGAWRAAKDPDAEPYSVEDLRAFHVVFV